MLTFCQRSCLPSKEIIKIIWFFVCLMVLNLTFNHISVISWRKTQRKSPTCRKSLTNKIICNFHILAFLKIYSVNLLNRNLRPCSKIPLLFIFHFHLLKFKHKKKSKKNQVFSLINCNIWNNIVEYWINVYVKSRYFRHLWW
jgi:hypothetical protein